MPEKMNYSQIYKKITKGLSQKTKGVFEKRFGVKTGTPETLESIGKSMGITRERVRQLEEAGFNAVRKNHQETLDAVFAHFSAYFKEQGGFKREDTALEDLGGKKGKRYALFFLALGQNFFTRVAGKKDYHYFWALAKDSAPDVKETLRQLAQDIQQYGKLLSKDELHAQFAAKHNLTEFALASYLQVSKRIQQNREGKFGLVEWPEIKPRGVKDKAFLVFKKEQRPLHFREIKELIDKMGQGHAQKKTHPQTVHNELIKDPRFVLIGRGTYALGEWGYVPGTIKDIIAKVLQAKQEPASQEDVVKEVLVQRQVAKNTILINLNNKKYFQKNAKGKYFLQKTETV